jgi:hypothetical protein
MISSFELACELTVDRLTGLYRFDSLQVLATCAEWLLRPCVLVLADVLFCCRSDAMPSAPRIREQSFSLDAERYLYTSRLSLALLSFASFFFHLFFSVWYDTVTSLFLSPTLLSSSSRTLASPLVGYDFHSSLRPPFFQEIGNRFTLQIAGRSGLEPYTTGKGSILNIHKTSCQEDPQYQTTRCRLSAVTKIMIMKPIAQHLLHHVLENTSRTKKSRASEHESILNSLAKSILTMEDQQ